MGILVVIFGNETGNFLGKKSEPKLGFVRDLGGGILNWALLKRDCDCEIGVKEAIIEAEGETKREWVRI
jgi:hypothetical protein